MHAIQGLTHRHIQIKTIHHGLQEGRGGTRNRQNTVGVDSQVHGPFRRGDVLHLRDLCRSGVHRRRHRPVTLRQDQGQRTSGLKT